MAPPCVAALAAACGFFAGLDPTAYPPLGALANRTSASISGSSLSVGAETTDRAFTNFASWSPFLGGLGAKSARVQAGWARCDGGPSTAGGPVAYTWDWLDAQVHGMLAVGVTPWLQTSFGNSAYPGGGDNATSSRLPEGSVALAAWDAWVAALVGRYAPLGVNTLELWNEPNCQKMTPSSYAVFASRTASTIKRVSPSSTVRYGVVCGVDTAYAVAVTQGVIAAGGAQLVDELTYHPYEYNPDNVYDDVAGMAAAIRALLPNVTLVQGENGAPSVGGGYGALTAYNWTECSQAKWFLRRLVRDNSLSIPSSAFSIADMCYAGPDGSINVNHKGLLLADCTTAGYPILRPKLAYTAVRHVTSVFDDSLAAVRSVYPSGVVNFTVTLSGSGGAAPPFKTYAAAWAATDGSGRLLFSAWNSNSTPVDAGELAPVFVDVGVSVSGLPLHASSSSAAATYVGVDMLSGAVFGLPSTRSAGGGVAAEGGRTTPLSLTFKGVPLLDYPTLIADQSLLHMG